MARHQVRGHILPTHTGLRMATRSKLLHPFLERPTPPLRKLHQLGLTSTVIALYWPHKQWLQELHIMTTETIHYPATHILFFPGRQSSHAGVGRPCWSVVAFRLPRRLGYTHAEVQYDALCGPQAHTSRTYAPSSTTHRYDYDQPATSSANSTLTHRGQLA
jgi:hypothetical protein